MAGAQPATVVPLFVSAAQVAEWLGDADTLVVDVRDDDFPGGNLRGAVNVPVDNFESDEQIHAFVQQHGVLSKTRVVLHCMLSQQRGPYAASRLARWFTRRLQSGALGASQHVPTVLVMDGGYRGFRREFEGRPELFDNLRGQPLARLTS